MNDDFNSPVLIAHLFDAVKFINALDNGLLSVSVKDLNELSRLMKAFFFDVLGLLTPETIKKNQKLLS